MEQKGSDDANSGPLDSRTEMLSKGESQGAGDVAEGQGGLEVT